MTGPRKLNSGQAAPAKGEYEVKTSAGKKTGESATMRKGVRLPPTDKPKQHFEKKK